MRVSHFLTPAEQFQVMQDPQDYQTAPEDKSGDQRD